MDLNRFQKQLQDIRLGDLVEVTWLDASRRKLETLERMREGGATGAQIDLHISSWAFTSASWAEIFTVIAGLIGNITGIFLTQRA